MIEENNLRLHAAPATDLQLNPDPMYPREFTGAGIARHSRRCQGFFGRRDHRCARCLELLHGSAPRGSEQGSAKARKLAHRQTRFLW
jgi:hypothetical protein